MTYGAGPSTQAIILPRNVPRRPRRSWGSSSKNRGLADLTVLRGVGADAAVAFVADLAEGLWVGVTEAVEYTVQGFAHGLDGRAGVIVGAAQGLRDDLVDDPAALHIRRCELECFGGFGRPARIPEDNRSTSLRRYDRKVGVLEHPDVVCGAHGQRSA